MARLPVATQQQQLSLQPAGVIKSVDVAQGLAKGIQQVGTKVAEVGQQWQKAQDYSETLNAKNKAKKGYMSIIEEAELFTDYDNPKQLEKQKNAYIQQLQSFDSELLTEFTSTNAANTFNQENEIASFATKSKINSIFRQKTIDMGKSNLVESYDANRDNFIASGSQAFKQSYINDLDGALAAGYITREFYAKQKENMEEWNKDKALNDAAVDPKLAEENVKNGVYGKMEAGEELELISQIQQISTKKKKVDEFYQIKQKDVNESNMMKTLQNSSISYDDRLKELNKKEFLGQISTKFASSARRYLTGVYEGTGLADTKNELMADIVLTSETLQAMGDDKAKEKLDEVNKLRNKIMKAQADGKLTDKDANAVNNKLNQSATITGEELEAVGEVVSKWSPFHYGYNNAYDAFKFQFGTAQGARMFKDYYYQVEGKDFDDNKKLEIVNTMINNNMQTENAQAVESIETFQSGKYKIRIKQ
jgi:hypothetical protein